MDGVECVLVPVADLIACGKTEVDLKECERLRAQDASEAAIRIEGVEATLASTEALLDAQRAENDRLRQDLVAPGLPWWSAVVVGAAGVALGVVVGVAL